MTLADRHLLGLLSVLSELAECQRVGDSDARPLGLTHVQHDVLLNCGTTRTRQVHASATSPVRWASPARAPSSSSPGWQQQACCSACRTPRTGEPPARGSPDWASASSTSSARRTCRACAGWSPGR